MQAAVTSEKKDRVVAAAVPAPSLYNLVTILTDTFDPSLLSSSSSCSFEKTLSGKSFLKGCKKLDPGKFSIDCCDPLGRTALVLAIECENMELIECLLKNGALPGDALLHAISEEYVEAVERLLIHEESIHVPNTPYVRRDDPLFLPRARQAILSDCVSSTLSPLSQGFDSCLLIICA